MVTGTAMRSSEWTWTIPFTFNDQMSRLVTLAAVAAVAIAIASQVPIPVVVAAATCEGSLTSEK
jgi:hypothetical protein